MVTFIKLHGFKIAIVVILLWLVSKYIKLEGSISTSFNTRPPLGSKQPSTPPATNNTVIDGGVAGGNSSPPPKPSSTGGNLPNGAWVASPPSKPSNTASMG